MIEPISKEAVGGTGSATGGETIGLVGVGLLGGAMAERLLKRGFGVMGFDLNASRLEELRARGGQGADSAVQVAQTCRRILLSLPDNPAVQVVLNQVASHLRPGQVLLDTTTGAPARAAETGPKLAAQSVAYLDAAVCGSSEELRRGEVLVVAGGPFEAYEECQDILTSFARRSWRVGEWGAGLRMKLTSNLVLGLHRAALAEGLAFAEGLGLDPELALSVLRESSSYSRVMDLKGQKMLDGDFAPQARLSQHLKDVRLMLEAAMKGGMKVPLSEQHCRLLEKAEAAGWGGLDNSAVIKVYRQH